MMTLDIKTLKSVDYFILIKIPPSPLKTHRDKQQGLFTLALLKLREIMSVQLKRNFHLIYEPSQKLKHHLSMHYISY